MTMPWLTQFLCTIPWISSAAHLYNIVNIHDTENIHDIINTLDILNIHNILNILDIVKIHNIVNIHDIANIHDTVNICPLCKHFFTVVNTAGNTRERRPKWVSNDIFQLKCEFLYQHFKMFWRKVAALQCIAWKPIVGIWRGIAELIWVDLSWIWRLLSWELLNSSEQNLFSIKRHWQL